MFNDHNGSFWNINTNLDHSCRNKNIKIAVFKLSHDFIFFSCFHFTVDKANAFSKVHFKSTIPFFSGGKIKLFRFFNKGADPVNALALLNFTLQPLNNIFNPFQGHKACINRLTSCRFFIKAADLHIAIGG